MPVICIPEIQRLRPSKLPKGLSAGVYRVPLKSSRPSRRLTDAEKAAAQMKNIVRRQSFQAALKKAQDAVEAAAVVMMEEFPGHQLEWYIRIILQTWTKSRTVKRDKTVSKWNAYLSIEVSRLNAERGSDSPVILASDVSKELGAKWRALSTEEQQSITKEKVKELSTAAEAKTHGAHRSQVTRFHDARAVVRHIQREASSVHILQPFFLATHHPFQIVPRL